MPRISFLSARWAWIASFTLSFFRIFTINFAEPSGSSPAENPPGKAMMWEDLISLTKASIDFSISSSFVFVKTT